MKNNRIVYTDDHPEYQFDSDLNWLRKYNGDYGEHTNMNYVTVVDTKTGIVYTGRDNEGSGHLGRDVEYFVKGK